MQSKRASMLTLELNIYSLCVLSIALVPFSFRPSRSATKKCPGACEGTPGRQRNCKAVTASVEKLLSQSIADDRHVKVRAVKAEEVVHPELRRLHVNVVIPARNHRRHGKPAMPGQVRHAALPSSAKSIPVIRPASSCAVSALERSTQAPLNSPPNPTTAVTDSGV